MLQLRVQPEPGPCLHLAWRVPARPVRGRQSTATRAGTRDAPTPPVYIEAGLQAAPATLARSYYGNSSFGTALASFGPRGLWRCLLRRQGEPGQEQQLECSCAVPPMGLVKGTVVRDRFGLVSFAGAASSIPTSEMVRFINTANN
jgi:hypothetical protein